MPSATLQPLLPRAEDTNYDEAKVPPYTLPDPLRMADGTLVRTAEHWLTQCRPQLLSLFERELYGRAPSRVTALEVRELARDRHAHGGLATRIELAVSFGFVGAPAAQRAELTLLLYLPNGFGKVPCLLGPNFFGNHSVDSDPALRLPRGWVPRNVQRADAGHVAHVAERGVHASRWPVSQILRRGYALATFYAGDMDPDFDDGFDNGVHGVFEPSVARRDDSWGSLAAWSFGLSRALDALTHVDEVDVKRVAVMGHSRFGKAALWAAALDTRFALAISNQSGCLGAALARRCFGERIHHVLGRFPHWLCARARRYAQAEDTLPFDQHALLALIAPRPLCVGSTADDGWFDAHGEFLACQAASPVYGLFGLAGVDPSLRAAPLGQGIGEQIGYHARSGPHSIGWLDFEHYLAFADRHMHAGGLR